MAIHVFAAIEVGSFELELGIYEISSKFGMKKIDHLRREIALGKDTFTNGKISYEMVEELCLILSDFVKVMKMYRVENYRAYAASALREAKNRQIVLDQIKVRTGLDVQAISNSEQKFLLYKALATKGDTFNEIIQQGTAIASLGFGSTQVSLFDKDTLVSTQNLRLGALRIREMLATIQGSEEIHQNILEEMVDNELHTFKKMYLKDREVKNLILVGDSLLFWAKRMYQEKQSNFIGAEDFQQICRLMIEMKNDEIERRFDLTTEYASVVKPCVMTAKRILESTGAQMVWIPGVLLIDGMAAEYGESIGKIKYKHNFEEDILAASRNMAKRYRCHGVHTQMMEKHVLGIFDAMKKYHGLGNRERLLLQIAAILHSCGKFVSMKAPSECGYDIIMFTEIIGLSHREREIIANVVQYNLETFHYSEVQSPGSSLLEQDVITIAKMTAILRLANSMDRSHKQKFKDCHMSVRDNKLVITTPYQDDMSLEKYTFDLKADFFEEIFGIRPVLKQKRRG
ncbi:MAG: exopolyphosphatase [bacterium]|nr:exopolyphosphatase [bacterium]